MTPIDNLLARLQVVVATDMPQHIGAVTVCAETPIFKGGLELDSFAFIEFINVLETNFGVELDERDFDEIHFRSLATVAELLVRRGAAVI